MSVPKRVKAIATAMPLLERHACDRCGYSSKDGGIISLARFKVSTPSGSVYLCGHHFLIHRFHIHERAYETTEL